jgi:hypothetical protein
MLNNKGFSNILVISIILVLLGVGGYFGYSYLNKPKAVTITKLNQNKQETSKTPEVKKPTEEYLSVDNEYNLYVNNELGLSIKLPKYVSYGYFDCQKNKNECEKFRKYLVLRQIKGTTKLGIYYKKDGVEKEFFDGYFGDMVKEPTLNFFNLKNQSEIESNIKQLFGAGCKVEKIILSKNGNYKTPVVTGSPNTCNFLLGVAIVNINKSETKMLISNFTGGQNFMFTADFKDSKSEEDTYKVYDSEFSDNIIFTTEVK